MKSRLSRLVWSSVIGATLSIGSAAAADTIKVGMLATFSGPYAEWGTHYKRAVEQYLDQINSTVDGHKIEMVYRDVGGVDPARARQLAQELVVREHVQYLTGGVFTPNVLAVAPIIEQAKIPYVVLNSGTSSVTLKSEWYTRLGFTQWSVSVPAAQWALDTHHKKASILVADYAPGADGIAAYTHTFEKAGATIASVVKVPMGTSDFSSYIQQLRNAAPDSVLMFMPAGPMAAGFIRSFTQSAMFKSGVMLYGGGDMQENILASVGPAAAGILGALHYGPFLDNPENKRFVAEWTRRHGNDIRELPAMAAVAAYDGIHLIAHMIEATGGKQDSAKAMAAAKGFSWNSPRGPVSIDPETREIIQNIYIREAVVADDGSVRMIARHTYPAVKDPWHELPPSERN